MSLSQDEINALMGGIASDDDPAEEETSVESDGDIGDNVADEQVDDAPTVPDVAASETKMAVKELTPDEIDVLGEIGNICMGAVATTMYTLLDRRVSITTPCVSLHTSQEVLNAYEIPFVVVRVGYVEGITGNNLLVLREEDAALITDLLMGGDGTVEQPVVLSELHLSAISEIMNQMMGASSTALSKLLHTPVNISTPQSMNVSPDKDVGDMLDSTEIVIKISFDMEIEGLLKSELLQILPYELGLDLAKKFMESGMGVPPAEVEKVEIPRGTSITPTASQAPHMIQMEQEPAMQQSAPPPPAPPQQMPQNAPPPQYAPPQPQYAPPPQYAQPYPAAGPAYQPPPYAMPYQQPAAHQGFVDVHPMSYQSFDSPAVQDMQQKSIDMIYDIPLQVTVELGKTRKEISEILEFGTGTIVVLDKIAGDPVEIIVNGKLIARGEVVVIEDNYGVRITEILNN